MVKSAQHASDVSIALERYTLALSRLNDAALDFNWLAYPATTDFRFFYQTAGVRKALDPNFDDTDERAQAGRIAEHLRELFNEYHLPEDAPVQDLVKSDAYRSDLVAKREELVAASDELQAALDALQEIVAFYTTALSE